MKSKTESILSNNQSFIPYEILCSVIPFGVDNAKTLMQIRKELRDYDVSSLKNMIEECRRVGAPIDVKNGKYYRVSTAKEYGDKILREEIKRKLGIENPIQYR